MPITEILLALLGGLALGWGIGAAVARRGARAEAAARAGELDAERQAHLATRESLARITEQRDGLERGRADDEARRAELEKTFQALASDALRSSNDQFLKLAKESFSKTETHHSQELSKRQQAIEHLVKPLEKGLERLDKFTGEIEKKRQEAYGELRTRLEQLVTTTQHLDQHSSALATALRGSSQARGRWGEIALRNIVELAGMTEHCDFTEQTTDRAGTRPDLVVRLPENRRIPVDAKMPFADYEAASREEDPKLRRQRLDAHAAALREKVRELARRDYARQLEGQVDFTLMFIPTEPILSAALERAPDLMTDAMALKVLLVTPVTLIALLRTVGIYWQQEKMAENAQHIWDEARELQRRLVIFTDHLGRIRKGLVGALDGYNDAVGSYRSRVLPQGRKMEELGALHDGKKPIPDLGEIETVARQVPEVAELPLGRSGETSEEAREDTEAPRIPRSDRFQEPKTP